MKILRVWKYALGSFHDDKTQEYDNWVCCIRTLIMLQLVVTNCFIVAGNIRHWNDAKHGQVSEWLKETDCKSVGHAYVGSNPTLPIDPL